MSPLLAAAASSSWAPAAINAVGTLASGLFGKKGPTFADQRKHTKRMELRRYGWLRDGALNAGFNPLTVLRATGGQMMQPQDMGSPLSTRAAIGEAIKTFAGTYAQDAIQRASEDRAQERWKEREDYVSPVSPVPRVASNSIANENALPAVGTQAAGIGERSFQAPSGRFPQADPFSDRPHEARIGSGPYRDRFIVAADDGFYLTPKGMGPAGVTEEILGSLPSEIKSLAELGKGAVQDAGFERVHWNADTGEVTGIAPKGARRPLQSTPEMPDERRKQRGIGTFDFPNRRPTPYNAWDQRLTNDFTPNLWGPLGGGPAKGN